MKINELLKKRPTLSFEIFPPKNNENDITSIYATIDELAKMNPDFISVTYGANGSTSKNTCKIASTIKNKYGIESVAHLTCMNNTKDEIKEILEELKENGIEVKIGVLEDKCKEMNKVFMKYITSQRPYVVLKSAMTIDGKISTAIGKSKWITGKEARLEGHKLRNELKGIMVGVNTIIADNPELTCRIDKGRNSIRIVVDSKLRIPLDAKVVNDQFKNKTIIATTEMAHKGKLKLLKDRGIDVIILEAKNNKVDLDRLMVSLAERKIDSILLEGGAELNYSALAEGIVDEVNIFIAPKIIGGREAKSAIAGDGVKELSQAFKLEKMSVGFIGEDIWIKGKVKRGE